MIDSCVLGWQWLLKGARKSLHGKLVESAGEGESFDVINYHPSSVLTRKQ